MGADARSRSLAALVALAGAVLVLSHGFAEDAGSSWHSRLENGLEVAVIPRHRVPVVTIEVAIKAGPAYERPATSGFAHLCEHMLFAGSATLSREAWNARASALGAQPNATTGTE